MEYVEILLSYTFFDTVGSIVNFTSRWGLVYQLQIVQQPQ